MPTRRRLLAVGGAGALAALSGCSDGRRLGVTESAGPVGTTREDTETTTAVPADVTGNAAGVYRSVIDSVVGVLVYDRDGRAGSGSGFVARIGDRSVVVTNQHVVGPGRRYQIRFRDNEWRSGELLGTDAYSDLAVLEADQPAAAEPLPMVATDPEPPIGTDVLAIGNPFGLGGSASSGVISGTDRLLPAPNNFLIADAVQTDAALNPGNSGGPLVTHDEEVAAVVNSAGGENIGFGVSAALSKRVLPELLSSGSYEHSFMGVQLTEVTPSIADVYELDEVAGVVVVGVLTDGPSDGSLQPTDGSDTVRGVDVQTGGDVIVGMDGQEIETQADLSKYLTLETSPGDELEIELVRDGGLETESITLGTRPAP